MLTCKAQLNYHWRTRKVGEPLGIIILFLFENETKTLNIIIDEEGIYPMKNEDHMEKDGTIIRGNQTDHNTITRVWDTTVQIQMGKNTIQIKTYDELERAIKQALPKTIGKKTINT